MSSAYNYKYQKVKNFRPEQHDVEISIGIGLMLVLVVATFIYFYADTTLVTPSIGKAVASSPAHQ